MKTGTVARVILEVRDIPKVAAPSQTHFDMRTIQLMKRARVQRVN